VAFTTALISELLRCTAGASAGTTITSVEALPTRRVRSKTCCAPTVSEIPVLSSVVYPFAETVTLYPPGSRFADIKKPSELVVTFVVTPAATFVITTEVPGRTPPDESVMVPESVAPATCALDGAEDRIATM
jgi:hypothetical protein